MISMLGDERTNQQESFWCKYVFFQNYVTDVGKKFSLTKFRMHLSLLITSIKGTHQSCCFIRSIILLYYEKMRCKQAISLDSMFDANYLF